MIDCYCAALMFLRDVKHTNDRHPAWQIGLAPVDVLKIDERLASLKTSERQLEDAANRLEKIGAADARKNIVDISRHILSLYQDQQYM